MDAELLHKHLHKGGEIITVIWESCLDLPKFCKLGNNWEEWKVIKIQWPMVWCPQTIPTNAASAPEPWQLFYVFFIVSLNHLYREIWREVNWMWLSLKNVNTFLKALWNSLEKSCSVALFLSGCWSLPNTNLLSPLLYLIFLLILELLLNHQIDTLYVAWNTAAVICI